MRCADEVIAPARYRLTLFEDAASTARREGKAPRQISARIPRAHLTRWGPSDACRPVSLSMRLLARGVPAQRRPSARSKVDVCSFTTSRRRPTGRGNRALMEVKAEGRWAVGSGDGRGSVRAAIAREQRGGAWTTYSPPGSETLDSGRSSALRIARSLRTACCAGNGLNKERSPAPITAPSAGPPTSSEGVSSSCRSSRAFSVATS